MSKKRGGRWISPKELHGGSLWLPEGARFDPEQPRRFERWCFKNLVFPAGFGGGKPVIWQEWQREHIIYPLLGLFWDDPPEDVPVGSRVVQQMFYLSARGTGKTTIAAALALWVLDDGWDPQPDIDLFAVSREQADRVFREAARFVQNSETLRGRYDIMSDRKIIHPAGVRNHGLYTRSGDSKAELGLRPTLVIFDELLSQRNRDLWDAARTGMGKRPESLLLSFTTPDVQVETFARQEYEQACRVRDDRAAYPHYLPVIFEADPDDDPFDEKTWEKAAPALGGQFLDRGVYRREAEEARHDPLAMRAFLVYRLAIWADAGGGWLDMGQWRKSAVEMPSREELAEMTCFFGLDMAANDDLASLAMLFVDNERGVLWVMWRHWMTDLTKRRVDKETQGALTRWMAEDNVDIWEFQGGWIDGPDVAEQVNDLAAEFRPEDIGIDSFRSREMFKMLGEEGLGWKVTLLRSTGRSMQAATERVAGEVGATRLRHNGDRVAEWAAGNCDVKYDPSGFPKVVKRGGDPTSPLKIDPLDALLMAMDRMLAWEREGGEFEAQAWLPPDLE